MLAQDLKKGDRFILRYGGTVARTLEVTSPVILTSRSVIVPVRWMGEIWLNIDQEMEMVEL